MSAVIVLTPVVAAAWPMIASAVVAAAAASGYKIVKGAEEEPVHKAVRERVEIEHENAQVVEDALSRDDRIVVEREGIRVTFSRDARGRFQTCVEGELPKDELRKVGEELSGRVIQQYMYRRLAAELNQNGFNVLAEDKGPDGSIRLQVRRYQG